MSDRPARRMLAAAVARARRVVLDRRQVAAGLAQAEADPDRAVAVARRRSRARASRGSTRPSARRNRPSSSETASWSVSAALICARSVASVGRERRGRQTRRRGRGRGEDDCAPTGSAGAATASAQTTGIRRRSVVAAIRSTCAAVARPSATQSGMPTPRKPLPVTKRPGCAASARSIAAMRVEVSDLVLRVGALPAVDARQQRIARDAEQRRSARERQRDELRVAICSSACGSRAPPTNVRSSTRSSGARCGHFDDSHDAARMPLPSTRGTTKPDPFSGWRDVGARGRRARRSRVDAYGTSLAEPRELRVRSRSTSAPVTYAGVASDDGAAARTSPDCGLARGTGRRARRSTRATPRVQPDGVRPAARADERAHHLAQAAGQRLERAVDAGVRAAVGARAAAKRAQQAAVLALGLDEAREQRVHRQPIDVAGVNAREQRLGEIRRRLARRSGASMKRADRLVGLVRAAAGTNSSAPMRSLPGHEKRRVRDERADARRNAEDRRGRQRMQAAAALDEGERAAAWSGRGDRRGRAPGRA